MLNWRCADMVSPMSRLEGNEMARRVIHALIDDLGGKPADESLAFGLDGVRYEIDLSTANASRLRDSIAPYVAAARKVGRGGVAATSRRRSYRPTGETRQEYRARNRAIREWGQRNGFDVSDRGRIKQHIIAMYDAQNDQLDSGTS